MADEMDRLLEDVFDAVSAQQLALSELIVELVESGSLSRTGAANVVVRSEAFIQHLAERSLGRAAHEHLASSVEARLALKPEIFVRRRRDPIEQERRYPKPPPGFDDDDG